MPKVRLSSGTIGTTRLPSSLSRSSVLSTRTNAMVVEISRSPVSLSWAANRSNFGARQGGRLGAPRRQVAAEVFAALAIVNHLFAVFSEA